MNNPIWISTATQCPDASPGSDEVGADLWQEVGLLASSEADLVQHVQRRLGLRSTAPRSAKGYLAAYPASPWVADVLSRYPGLQHGSGAADAPDRFWLAVDVTSGAATPRFLVGVKQARLTTLQRRPPEAHPGLIEPTVPLPISLPAAGGQVFR